MATRKDLLKAHGFTTQRLVSALVDRSPDDAQPPLRRVSTATFVSILLGVVLLAGSALFGMVRKQVTVDQWQKDNVVIMDSGSGALFTWDQENSQLIPFTDVTSARLFAANGKGSPDLVTVKPKDLKGVKQAPRRGIPQAPYQLPLPANIKPFPLRVCATEPTDTGDRFLTVQMGDKAPTTKESVDIAVQTTGDDAQYLVVNGSAHKLVDQGPMSPLIEDFPVVKVSPAWLASLPQGQPIRRQLPQGHGASAGEQGPATVGSLYRRGEPDDPNTAYYIQLADGIHRISWIDMRLLSLTQKQDPRPLDDETFARHYTGETWGTPGLPANKPQTPKNTSGLEEKSLCATYPGGDQTTPMITLGAPTPTIPASIINPRRTKADVIEMDPLTGAILQNQTLKGDHTSAFLVTGGRIYGIPDIASREALGYPLRTTPAGRVPAGLLALFPDGLPAGVELGKGSVVALP